MTGTTFCKTYAMTPEDLFYMWQSFTFNRKTDMGQFSPDQIPAFRDYINSEIKSRAKQKAKVNHTPARTNVNAVPRTVKSAYGARMLAAGSTGLQTPESALKKSVKMEDVKPILPLDLSDPVASGSGSGGGGLGVKNVVIPAANSSEFSCEFSCPSPLFLLGTNRTLPLKIDTCMRRLMNEQTVCHGRSEKGQTPSFTPSWNSTRLKDRRIWTVHHRILRLNRRHRRPQPSHRGKPLSLNTRPVK